VPESPQPPSLIVGSPEEWASFAEARPGFFEKHGVLRAAIDLAFTKVQSDTLPDLVIFLSSRLCADEFREIFLLSANGHGLAALRLLRGMYERAVTARFLHLHPEATQDFVDYGVIQKGKFASALLENAGDLSQERVERLKQAKADKDAMVAEDKQATSPRFQVSVCKPCSTTRLNHTWTRLDFVTMAKQVGTLGGFLASCYHEPTFHTHGTVIALEACTESVGEDAFKLLFGPRRKEAARALMLAHAILLNVLGLIAERFQVAGLPEALDLAGKAYLEVWGLDVDAAIAPKP